MGFQDDPSIIRWRLHLKSPPESVYEMLSTNEGRARFWAESAVERGGAINFIFPNNQRWRAKVIEAEPPRRFAVEYFGSTASFDIAGDGAGGTELTLTHTDVSPREREEVIAGWVSVLLALKAAVDFRIDLRNHDANRTWDDGFVEN